MKWDAHQPPLLSHAGGRGFSGLLLFFFLRDTDYWRHLSHILTDNLNFKKSDVWNRFVCSGLL